MEYKTIKFHRTLTVRLMPTKEQEEKFYQFAGASRWIWNEYLAFQIAHYDNNSRYINKKVFYQYAKDFGKKLTQMRNSEEYAWLKEIPRHTISQVMQHLNDAYTRVFNNQDKNIFEYSDSVKRKCARENRFPKKQERKHHPHFKRKKDNEYSFASGDNGETNFKLIDNQLYVNVPKVGKVLVQANTKYSIPFGNQTNGLQTITKPQVKLVHGKWLLYFAIECEKQVPIKQENNDRVIGIDLGLKVLAAVSNYGKDYNFKLFENINKTNPKIKQLEERLDALHHKLSNQYETNHRKAKAHGDLSHKYGNRSKRIQKTINKLRDIYFKLHNIRNDYIHKSSRDIVNQHPRAIVLEDLDLAFMCQNHHISKSEASQCLGFFRQILEYKAVEEGIEVIYADKLYPSTKLCSKCREKQDISLSTRTYKCKHCGLELDRDYNAALNLELYGVYKVLAFSNEC